MDPSQNYNFFANYNFPYQPQNPNIRPPNPENPDSGSQPTPGMQPNSGMPYMMPSNYGMQYPYNQPYMPYGYQPSFGNNCYVPAPVNCPTTEHSTEPNTPRFSSGSTEIPDFGTQISLGDIGGDTPNNFIPPTQQSTRKSNYDSWSTEDNKLLLAAFFHFSNDSQLGNNQKGDTFWSKIADYMNEKCEGGKQRTWIKCKSKFRAINPKITKFVGCYSAACRQRRSGWSDDDYITKAFALYHEQEGTKFSLVEEWKLVRHQPKYMPCAPESGSSGSKRKSSDDSVTPSLVRPEGRDVAKKKARASSSKSKTYRKSKADIEDELSNLTSEQESFLESQKSASAVMAEYTKIRKLKLLHTLKNKPERDEIDEDTYQMLVKDLFGK